VASPRTVFAILVSVWALFTLTHALPPLAADAVGWAAGEGLDAEAPEGATAARRAANGALLLVALAALVAARRLARSVLPERGPERWGGVRPWLEVGVVAAGIPLLAEGLAYAALALAAYAGSAGVEALPGAPVRRWMAEGLGTALVGLLALSAPRLLHRVGPGAAWRPEPAP
jgi:hypothetical protein